MPPAPIFTKKKPRQALLAHPNNSDSSNERFGSYNTSLPKRQPVYNNIANPGTSTSWNKRQPDPYPTANPEPATKKRVFNSTPARRPLASVSQTAQNVQHHSGFQSTQPTWPRPQGVSAPRAPATITTYGGQPRPQPSHSAQQPWGAPAVPRGRQQQPGIHSNRGTHGNSTYSHSANAAGPSGAGTSKTWGNLDRAVQQASGQHTVVEMPPKKAPVAVPSTNTATVAQEKKADVSLHFLAANIAGMKHWSQYRNKLPLIFELMGTLGSAVTSIDCGKQFVLKDDKESVSCTFYTIDRELPRMVRGHWYRCVGQLAADGERFRTVTIREVSEEERKLHRAHVTVSDRTMRTWTGGNREI